MNNLEIRKNKLDTDISIFTWLGGICAALAVAPLVYVGRQVLYLGYGYQENVLGDFIGGISGTFASFAGLSFIYVGFLGQQLQIVFQQEELELNRNELINTRLEIAGQREQLELQNKQFENQMFENSFFFLFNNFKTSYSNEIRGSWEKEISTKIKSLMYQESENEFGHKKVELYRKLEDLELLGIQDRLSLLPQKLLNTLKGEFSPLLSVLSHIKDKNQGESHYFQTLIYSIKYTDKFILFYSFIPNNSKFTKEEKHMLIDLFEKFPDEVFLSVNHKKFLKELG